MLKNLPAIEETQVWSLGQEGPLEKGMATHSSVLPGESMDRGAWRATVVNTIERLHFNFFFSILEAKYSPSWPLFPQSQFCSAFTLQDMIKKNVVIPIWLDNTTLYSENDIHQSRRKHRFTQKGASHVAQLVKNPPAMQETSVQFLGRENPLENGQAAHSSIVGLPRWLGWYKDSACHAGDLGSIPGFGRSPGEENGYPLQYSGLYSPWGRQELDTTEWLSLRFTQKKLKNEINCLHQPSLHLYSQTQWGSPRECRGLSHSVPPTSSEFHCQG